MTPGSLIMLVMLVSTCTGPQIRDETAFNTIPSQVRQDLAVSGTIRVKGEIKVFSGATLTVSPGTRFLFEPYDPDGDGVNDSRLVIEGVLVARGDPDAPIYFSSAASEPEPGDWLELRMDHSEGSVLEYCVLEHSRYGLHVHFSSGMVANSVFRKNIDGTRFGNSQFEFHFNRITENLGKGVNLRASRLWVLANLIEKNRHGAFLFEEGGETAFVLNKFADNDLSDLRFGDFYNGDPPALLDNYRPDGSFLDVVGYEGDPDKLQESYDLETIENASGPQVWRIRSEKIWSRDLGSFIDASPVLDDFVRKVIVSTWENGLYILDTRSGETISKINVPDVTDAVPVIWDGPSAVHSGTSAFVQDVKTAIFPSWDLKIRKADIESGKVLGEISWNPSMADDHRQASPLGIHLTGEIGSAVALGLWNGQFGVLDPGSMEWLWKVKLDGAIRARAAEGDKELWVGTDAGSLYRISMEGEITGRFELGAPVRTTPLVVEKGSVVVVTGAGHLLRLTEGETAWKRKLPGPGTYASPVWLVPSHRYFVVGDGAGKLSAYSVDGALMWRKSMGSAVHVIAGEEMEAGGFAGTENGSLEMFDYLGKSLLQLQAEGAVHGAVFNIDSEVENTVEITVIWGSRDGEIRAVKVSAVFSPWEPPAP